MAIFKAKRAGVVLQVGMFLLWGPDQGNHVIANGGIPKTMP